jgi:hypothetical protein
MADGFSTEVMVKRRARDGWFVYTCDELPGLFVASQDDRAAYEDVPRSIETLFRLDHGIDCVVTQKLSYAELVKQLHVKARARENLADRLTELMADPSNRLTFAVHPHRDGSRTTQ